MKKKLLSLLLALSVTAAVAVPSAPALAEGSGNVPAVPLLADDNGLELRKTAKVNTTGGYDITLESWTTGNIKPLDIILVLDQSDSMRDRNLQDAMKSAANNFIDAVAGQYSDTYNHRIRVLPYGDNPDDQKTGWVSVDTAGTAALHNAVNGLATPERNAERDIGTAMERANSLMDDISTPERQQVAILFTSGLPAEGGSDQFQEGNANRAIAASKAMKDRGALVYAVGIFNGANPNELHGSSGFHHNSNGTPGSHWCEYLGTDSPFPRDISANNRFLNYLSSNSSDAQNLGLRADSWWGSGHIGGYYGWEIARNWSCDTNQGYYLAASDASALDGLFKSILDNIQQADIDLGADTEIRDVVSEYFTIQGNIACSAVPFNGTSFEETGSTPSGVTASVDGNNITVTGFDFNGNYVSQALKADGTYGCKLVITFTVQCAPGFMGGNNVPTNGETSGVYDRTDELVEAFEVPTVNVPIAYDFTTSSQTIFLGEEASDLAERVTHVNPYTPNGTNNAFVTITYELKGPDDTTVGTYTVNPRETAGTWNWYENDNTPALTEDTNYTVTCTVSPSKTVEGGVGNWTDDKSFVIKVLSGELTITKQGGAADETYIFNIYKDGGETPYMTVTTGGNESVTITRLPKGKYRVEEDTTWSWRYDPAFVGSNEVTINKDNLSGSVTCTNTKTENQWLNGYAGAVNEYTAEGGAN